VGAVTSLMRGERAHVNQWSREPSHGKKLASVCAANWAQAPPIDQSGALLTTYKLRVGGTGIRALDNRQGGGDLKLSTNNYRSPAQDVDSVGVCIL